MLFYIHYFLVAFLFGRELKEEGETYVFGCSINKIGIESSGAIEKIRERRSDNGD